MKFIRCIKIYYIIVFKKLEKYVIINELYKNRYCGGYIMKKTILTKKFLVCKMIAFLLVLSLSVFCYGGVGHLGYVYADEPSTTETAETTETTEESATTEDASTTETVVKKKNGCYRLEEY